MQKARPKRLRLQNDGIGAAAGITRIHGRQFAVSGGLQEDIAHTLDVDGGIRNGLADRVGGGHIFGLADQIGQPRVLDRNRISQRCDRELVPLARSTRRQ